MVASRILSLAETWTGWGESSGLACDRSGYGPGRFGLLLRGHRWRRVAWQKTLCVLPGLLGEKSYWIREYEYQECGTDLLHLTLLPGNA